MKNSIVLLAYEINALTAKELLQKRDGFKAKFKKFKSSEIVDHVAGCWEELESLLNSEKIKVEDRILYTAKLSDPLRIGKTRNDILNNSFLMAALSDNTQFGREALEGARYYQLKSNSEFERKQFALLLEDLKDQFSNQEVGILGWISLDEDLVDDVLKNLASKFNASNDGELHFIEFTNDGDIFPNFSNVRSQKFEGKLAGNYSLTLKQSDYATGIHRINEITKTVTRKTAISLSSEKYEGVNIETPIDAMEQNMTDSVNKKNSYSEDFKREVAEAAQKSGATLASVGEQFGVSPTLVRNWKIKFLEVADNPKTAVNNKPKLSVQAIQSWMQNSAIEGTVDGDGDLYVSLETSADNITEEATKLFITGTQKLASGSKNETSEISDQLTTNETNWLRSDFLKGVGSENTQFAYNLSCDVYGCSDKVTLPIKLKKGKVSECPIKAGQIELSELNFIFEDGDFRAEGTIKGPNGFIYAAEVLTEEPEEGHVPSANKTADDENFAEMYEFLWDVKKGDTVFLVLCAFEKLDGKLSCGFTGEAQVEEPTSYDEDDGDTDENEGPEVEDVETKDGDIGLFEFQIKRGLVDEDEIEDEDVQKLIDELKQLCEDENYEEAANLLLSNLSFEFGPDQLDDDPERFFANTDYIEFECSSENTSIKIGYDDCLVVTISVQFEIPLNAGISTAELAEYLPDSGAWASASASPGWGYAGSDGDNVWFLGIKGQE